MSDGASPRPASRTLGGLVDEMATFTPGAEALVFRDERLEELTAAGAVRGGIAVHDLIAVGTDLFGDLRAIRKLDD